MITRFYHTGSCTASRVGACHHFSTSDTGGCGNTSCSPTRGVSSHHHYRRTDRLEGQAARTIANPCAASADTAFAFAVNVGTPFTAP